MPEWLLKNDEYIPPKEQHKFIDKTIISVINLFSGIGKNSQSKTGKVNVNLKVIFTFINIVFAVTSRSFPFIFILITYELIYLSLIDGKTMVKVLKGTFTGVIFTFLIIFPSILFGNSNGLILIIKAIGIIALINILSHTESTGSIISSFKTFRLPDVFIFILDTSIKYIYILGDLALNMLYSLKTRSIGKFQDKYSPLSGIMGNLFLKSKDYSRDMYYAMELRGFDGTYVKLSTKKLNKYDFIYMIANVIIILSYIYSRLVVMI